MGARASSLGYTSSCLTDEWSVFNNIAGLAKVNVPVAAVTCDVQPSFKPFNKVAGVLVVPVKIGVTGIGVYRFGDDLYSEQIISAAYSNTFGLASLGIKCNYVQYNISGFGKKGVFSVSFGGIAELTPKIKVGAHIINLNQPKVSVIDKERLPTTLIVGLALKLSESTSVMTELEKEMEFSPRWKTGIEYRVHKKFFFRTGINVQPNAGFFGFGFKHRKFACDYAYQYDPQVGSRHQASIAYKLKHEKK
jgi:hypothetical protein